MIRTLWEAGLGIVIVGATFFFAGSVLAHPPFCICKAIDATAVRCEGGFADGNGVPGVKLEVIRYDESVGLATSVEQCE
jgi:hypothetical protein